MHRRSAFLLLAAALLRPVVAFAQEEAAPFDRNTVRGMARDLAAKPFRAPDAELPRALADLDYDRYRTLRFDPQRALWRGDDLPFQAQLFHRGFLYRDRVLLHEVVGDRARPVAYDPATFDFGAVERPAPADLGFAGFRIHGPINRADYFDEICAFLGASYFRAVGKGQGYGLSARGLAIRTADPAGEEFPLFRAFWLERPRAGVNSLVVHALLDSPSAAASFRFTIRPGEDTVFDVEATIFPRADVEAAGIAPLTSMYFFGPGGPGHDDWRPAVHDSDGLMMATGRGEQLWRPLSNPRDLQLSAFGDSNPRGFGLMQRPRAFSDYQDLEARYEKRPSLWVEPIGDWGEGAVHLVEIPTQSEIHDNVVAAWRPKEPLRACGEYGYVYRLHWLPAAPGNPGLAQFGATRSGVGGHGGDRGARLFVLGARGGALANLPADARPELEVSAGTGQIRNAVAQPNPEGGGWRIAFELVPGDARLAELRALLKLNGAPLTETWVHRWTA